MKCRTHICKAACCYNIPFEKGELTLFKDRIVNKVLYTTQLMTGIVAFTNPDPNKNKCPFLRADCKCNIYENRPEVCRLFGTIEKLKCSYIKK